MNLIACEGEPLATFFDEGETPYSEALAKARAFCDTCPARTACLAMEMDAEKGESVDHRAGIFGGMTPHQRLSLHKRGVGLRCAECTLRYDPVELRNGVMRCDCGTKRSTPIPDRGDQWMPRHIKLARMTLVWLNANLRKGDEVPDALSLSRTMKVGVKDLRRVFQALREDHVIKRNSGGKLVFCGRTTSEFDWTPPHLRSSH